MSWPDWIVENTLNRASKLEMIKIMIDGGISEDEAIALVANVKNLPGYQIAEKLFTEKNKLIFLPDVAQAFRLSCGQNACV